MRQLVTYSAVTVPLFHDLECFHYPPSGSISGDVDVHANSHVVELDECLGELLGRHVGAASEVRVIRVGLEHERGAP